MGKKIRFWGKDRNISKRNLNIGKMQYVNSKEAEEKST